MQEIKNITDISTDEKRADSSSSSSFSQLSDSGEDEITDTQKGTIVESKIIIPNNFPDFILELAKTRQVFSFLAKKIKKNLKLIAIKFDFFCFVLPFWYIADKVKAFVISAEGLKRY